MFLDIEPINLQSDIIEASKRAPVLVDFWAEWCAPCLMLSPVLEKLANEAGDDWILVKVNTEIQPDIAMQYSIRGIPNVKMFVGGEIAGEFIGAMPEGQIKDWLNENLPKDGNLKS